MSDHHAHESKPSCGGGCCGHGHEESALPQGLLVTISGILTGAGLVIGWTAFGPAWLETLVFVIATLAVAFSCSPTHGRPCWPCGST